MVEPGEPAPEDGRLLANIMHFARVLRAAGLAIGPGTVIDAVDSMLEERGEDFRTFALHDLSTDSTVRPLTSSTDEDGTLWLFMGLDSGYAGFTTQFHDAVEVTLTPQ